MTQRTPVHSLRGREGNQGIREGNQGRESARREGACYKSCDAFVQSAFFLAGNRTRNGEASVIAFKNLFTLETCFQHRFMFSSILTKRIYDRSAQFLLNFFEKIVMAANNSGFYSTYLFVSENNNNNNKCYLARVISA